MNKKPEPEVRLVITTFPDIEVARQIGTFLVESQLIACINLVPKVESIYQWQGKIEQETEVLGIMKTTKSQTEPLQNALSEKHPYDVPEMLIITNLEGLPDYFNWIISTLE